MCSLLPFPPVTALAPSRTSQPASQSPISGAPAQPPAASAPEAAAFAPPAAQPSPTLPAAIASTLDRARSAARHPGVAY